jgi:hypothetical protein
MVILTALVIALAVAVVVLARCARRYGKARVAALNRDGWEKVPGHCVTVDGPRYPDCPLTIIETAARWERVRAAEIRPSPPRRSPAQRLRRR